jgi:hypothetical protein
MLNEPATSLADGKLGYAPPPATTDLTFDRQDGGIRIELGPMSGSLLVATVVPWALWLGILFGLAVMLTSRHDPWGWLTIAGFSVTAILSLATLSKYRHQPRVVGVVQGQLFYSDARTRGVPMGIARIEIMALRVFRSWWPWIFQLTTVPPAKLLGVSATHPVVLLIGLDWRFLDLIRRELSLALGLEPNPVGTCRPS